MGISGLWDELAEAREKKALTKLAIEWWESNSRPLTVAIDTSIWHFQVRSGKEGSNPLLRTFYYRLCRLLLLNIRPMFVFDGPQKPAFKRNRFSGALPPQEQREEINYMKLLISAFGFLSWDAPGEAEAECAALQRLGIVDMVITEDVDAIMFGATKVVREITNTNKTRTHIYLYQDVEEMTGLDKDALVLIAMMSGGDYLPAGLPACGPVTAVEIAKAGYGKTLMRTKNFEEWRSDLAVALTTNSDDHFSKKRPSLAARLIQSNFPDVSILNYYAQPKISPFDKFSSFQPNWKGPDINRLAGLCKELFQWNTHWGMCRFIRSFAPAYLIFELANDKGKSPAIASSQQNITSTSKLLSKPKHSTKVPASTNQITTYFKPTKTVAPVEKDKDPSPPPSKPSEKLFSDIHGSRKHLSTDEVEELRLSYIPSQLVPYIPLNFDLVPRAPYRPASPTKSPSKRRPPSPSKTSRDSEEEEAADFDDDDLKVPRESKWSPDEIDRIWIPKVYVANRYPQEVELWEQEQEAKKSPKRQKTPKKKPSMSSGAMEQFVVRQPPPKMKSPVRMENNPPNLNVVENTPVSKMKTLKLDIEKVWEERFLQDSDDEEPLPSPSDFKAFMAYGSKTKSVSKETLSIDTPRKDSGDVRPGLKDKDGNVSPKTPVKKSSSSFGLAGSKMDLTFWESPGGTMHELGD